MFPDEHMSDEMKTALNKFIKNMPSQILYIIMEETDSDPRRGYELMKKMFLKTSDYARKQFGWIDELVL